MLKQKEKPRTPVYQQIKDVLQSEIKQGKYKPGEVLPSVNQLAKMFYTSRNTAVKAITDLAHEGAIYCVQGKGSVVNDLRTTIKSKLNKPSRPGKNPSIHEIGILMADFDDIHHPYFVKVLQGISKQARNFPCNLKTFCINNYSIKDFIQTENFDGLIVVTELPHSSVMLLKQNNIPFVLANNDIYGEELYCVTIDSYRVTFEAVKYLHSLGHKKISVLPGPSHARSTSISYLAYKNAMSELGLEVNESFFKACDYGEEGGYTAFNTFVERNNVPTAVITLEDYIANGVIKAAEEHNIKVPSELSVIGNGNMQGGSNVKIPLTTFNDKLEDLGANCLKMLERQLNGMPIKNPKINLKPEIIIRTSCAKR